jgi:membrane fusion protein, heavy metal efflux system
VLSYSNKKIAAAFFSLATIPVLAGPGHDHGEAPAAAPANAPTRQADGSVFLPKPAQRQLGIRTIRVETRREARAFELPGRVVIDPAKGGRVQPMQAGRLAVGPRGFPQLGARVAKGEILAYVMPAISAVDQANQRAMAAELQAGLASARARVTRLQQLEGSVPRREIDEAKIQLEAFEKRAASVSSSVGAREALVAPVAGVVASMSGTVAIGQMVDARETLFEITDPGSIAIEAYAFDAAAIADIESASIAAGGASIALEFAGASRSLREGQIPVIFRASSAKNASKSSPIKDFVEKAIGEPVTVIARSRRTSEGIAVPAASVVKNPSNQDVVWVVDSAERFRPRLVRHVPLDGARVLVVSGLRSGARVVTDGATLINQVR